jgi:Ca2+-binding RTX toxin-like protein
MTVLIARSAHDMTDWDFLDDIADGTVAAHTKSVWNITGKDASNTYSFGGNDLSYGTGGNPTPLAGLIRNFSFSQNGTQALAISGAISAADLADYILAGDVTGLQREWFSGDDLMNGSTGDDHLIGYDGNDLFRLDNGGSDTAEGGKGDDTFQLRASFDNTDRILGGNGTDTLRLNADYFLICSAEMLSNVEIISLTQGKDYVLHLAGANVGTDGLLVDGSMLHDGHVEVYLHDGTRGITALGGDNADAFSGSGGKDVFVGGAAGDSLRGGDGEDTLTGGAGKDTFVYNFATASTGAHYDTITDFDTSGDLIGLDYALGGVDAMVTHGKLDQAHFNDRLEKAVDAEALAANHAVLFRPHDGDFQGQMFLVVDANGVAGYQRDADYVIRLADLSQPGSLALEDFVLNV